MLKINKVIESDDGYTMAVSLMVKFELPSIGINIIKPLYSENMSF